MAAFAKGDRVAWSHAHGVYAPGSVLFESASAPDARLGEVLGTANEEKTYFEVKLDDGKTVVLTGDELVKVAPDA